MNLHEYQAKEILQGFGVPVQQGTAVDTVEEAIAAAKRLQVEKGTDFWVIKAQIHAGGRGKGGGVQLAKSIEEVKEKATKILGMQLVTPQTGPQGKKVNKILVAEDVYYPGKTKPKEFYLGILLDRARNCNVIMYSTQGGVDIEEVAAKTPHLLFKEWIAPKGGLLAFQARKIAFKLGLSPTSISGQAGDGFRNMTKFITNLYKCYISIDASMVEINPMLKTADNKILAVDAKVNLDDNALYRQPDYAKMRDITEEDPAEVEASENSLNFVKLDGNVGCMVNGAGLAMATMDIIKLAGGSPANFLDVGGSASAQTVEAGFRIILKDPAVKALLVNIFGGIVRCDRVAQGIVDAYKNIGEIKVPIIVRLQGTNAEEAKKLIDDSGLKVNSAILLQEAADLVTQVLN